MVRRPLAACAITLLVAASFGACSSSSSPSTDTSADAQSVDVASDVPVADAGDAADSSDAAPTMKAPLRGLIDMQNISWHNSEGGEPTFTIANVNQFPGVFGGIVVNATWDAIQPSQTGALDFSTIDAALDQVRTYNTSHPTASLGVKLRVYAGANAPAWAKSIDGGPVTIFRNPAGCDGDAGTCALTLGKFWTPDYISAWRNFQAQLAARYDADPLIRHVAVTSCAQQTDEPFVPTVDAVSKSNLTTAGYSDAAQQACLSLAVDDYAAWKLTLVDYTFNVFTPLSGPSDSTFPISVMQQCRTSLGARCVLDNHVLESPLYAPDQPIFTAIASMAGPTNFQTGSPEQMSCQWTATIAQGVALGAVGIEVWPDAKFHGIDSLSSTDVSELASEFTTPIAVSDGGDGGGCPNFH